MTKVFLVYMKIREGKVGEWTTGSSYPQLFGIFSSREAAQNYLKETPPESPPGTLTSSEPWIEEETVRD